MSLLQQRKPKRIGLTALIDAVFILLLFFMLSSTFTTYNSIELQSSNSNNSSADQNQNDTQFIVLYPDDSVARRESRGTRLEAAKLLQSMDKQNPVIVLPISQTNVQSIVTLLTNVKAAGFNNVTLGSPIE